MATDGFSRSLPKFLHPLPAAAVAAVLVVMLLMTNRSPDKSSPLRVVAGHSVEGRPLEYWVFGNGTHVMLFMASIHGSEGGDRLPSSAHRLH